MHIYEVIILCYFQFFQWFLKKLNPFSKVSEEIKPSEENFSQSGSGPRTADEESNGQVRNFFDKW